jgi:lysophospholipase L1-like esterase
VSNKHKLTLLGLGALAAASLVINGLLLRLVRRYYIDAQEVRLDPLGLQAAGISLTPGPAPEGVTRVVFFGDSRARQWSTPEGLEGFEFVRRGLDGQTSAQVLERYRYLVRPLRQDVVVLQAGVNDLRLLALYPEREAELAAACLANLRALVDLAVADGATVILTTVFPAGPAPVHERLFWLPPLVEAIATVNAELAGWAGPDVVVLDTAAILTEDGAVRAEFAFDALHLNDAGYAALNVVLVEMLRSLGE